MRDRLHSEAMSKQLLADPAYLAELLNAVLEEGDSAELRVLIRYLMLAYVTNDQTPRVLSEGGDVARERHSDSH